MHPKDTAARYDRIAQWWQTQHQDSLYGIEQLERAIKFTPKKDWAIDIGCGSSGRFLKVLGEHGYQVEGLDISAEMIDLAKQLHPDISFYKQDICCWMPLKSYSLIVAWDSTFHLPLDMQELVLKKLCDALEGDGVLMFTCGGGHKQGEVSGTFQGQNFDYSSSP